MEKLWHIVRFELPKGRLDDLTVFLHDTEVAGILEEEKTESIVVTAYYDPDSLDLKDIQKISASFLSLPENSQVICRYETAKLDDWTNNWKQWFTPFEIAPGITISPTWEKDAIPSDKKIIIDPKMAFGTGLHPTTKLCASEIYRLKPAGENRSIMDVGTGSGILAMLAGKLGFSPIAAVENDPVAAEIAAENFLLNGMPEVNVMPDISVSSGKYDLVVANILLCTLIEIKEELVGALAPRGNLILSGITHDQSEELLNAFSGSISLQRHDMMGEWSSMTFVAKES